MRSAARWNVGEHGKRVVRRRAQREGQLVAADGLARPENMEVQRSARGHEVRDELLRIPASRSKGGKHLGGWNSPPRQGTNRRTNMFDLGLGSPHQHAHLGRWATDGWGCIGSFPKDRNSTGTDNHETARSPPPGGEES